MKWIRFVLFQALCSSSLALTISLLAQAADTTQESATISNTTGAGASSLEPSYSVMISLENQAISVVQFSDVQPTDWAFQALQSLIERYGAITGYPDSTFRGSRSMTRYEFAEALSRVLEVVQEGFNATISSEDLALLQRLQQDFASELATLGARADVLEAEVDELESNQFSTTAQLRGQAIFAVNEGGFDGDRILTPSGEILTEQDPNATLIYRVSLDFDVSFTGTDLLRIRLDTGSGGPNDNAGGSLEPTFGSTLDFSAKPPSDGDFGIGRLFFTFNPIHNVTVSLAPNMRITDYVDRNSYANFSFRDFSTSAIVNNYVLIPINGPSAGAAVTWNIGDGPFTVRALYAAADAANASDQGPVRGTAPFIRFLYPESVLPGADLGDRGLFGDTHQGLVELEYAPSSTTVIRLQYSGGSVFDQSFNAVGVNAEVAIAPWLAIFGRYGFSRYSDTAFGEIEPNYWMAGVAFPDLFQRGTLAGVAVAQPFIANQIGNATQTNIEAFYRIPLSNNIQITPILQVITDPANQNDNSTIITGTLRTTLFF